MVAGVVFNKAAERFDRKMAQAKLGKTRIWGIIGDNPALRAPRVLDVAQHLKAEVVATGELETRRVLQTVIATRSAAEFIPSLKPGTLVICTGTACHVKGNDRILVRMRDQYHLAPGETTPDNKLSLVEVRCVGACALAPVIIPDGTLIGKKNYAEATAIIEEWLNDAS